jgi:ribosomal 50S subunit-associated protein YjgA (DUF615 family)
MSLLLPLTDTAIEDYQIHVRQHPDTDLGILAYLTRHINGLMCAEIEQAVSRLIRERLEIGCSDAATSNFLKSGGYSSIRNAKLEEIRKAVTRFGDAYKEKFDLLVGQTIGEADRGKLGMAVGRRNQDAHENPPNITFRELEEAFRVATFVVEAVRTTLGE